MDDKENIYFNFGSVLVIIAHDINNSLSSGFLMT